MRVSVWRNNNESKVWYEWSISVYDEKGRKINGTHIHNINGRGFAIG